MKHTKVVYLLTKVLAILFSSEKNEAKDCILHEVKLRYWQCYYLDADSYVYIHGIIGLFILNLCQIFYL